MYKTLAIFDRDAEYLRHLADYIKAKAPGLLYLKLFTKEEVLREFLEGESVDILLIEEGIPEIDEIKGFCRQLVLLTQNAEAEVKSSLHSIYKYQPGEIILKELKKLLPEDPLSNNVRNTSKKEIISIISLNSARLSQGFSISLWDKQSNDQKILFTTLQAYPLLKELMPQKGEGGLSEFLYYLKQNSPELSKKIKEYIQHNGKFEYIKAVSFGTDVYELTAEDMANWLNLLPQLGYDAFLFEIGFINQSSFRLLQESKIIYLVSEEDNTAMKQAEGFLQQLSWAGYEEIVKKVVKIKAEKESISVFEEYFQKGLMGAARRELDKTGDY